MHKNDTTYHGYIIDSARKLALAEHTGQTHGILPYSYHLSAVAGLVSCFSTDPEVIAAAWLHDIVEDCPDIDLEVVEQMTSARTAHLVDLLTDPPGMSRQNAKAISIPAISSDPDASLIKLCDRYHNHASAIMDRSQKYARVYFYEYDYFVDTLGGYPAHKELLIMIGRQYAPLLRLARVML